MGYFEFVRQFFVRYYPRQHVAAAAVLALSLLVLTALATGNKSPSSGPVASLPAGSPFSQPATKTTDLPDTSASRVQASGASEPVPLSTPGQAESGGQVLRSPAGDAVAELTREVPEEPQQQSWQHMEVMPGDNLSTLFSRVGLSDRELFHVLNSNEEAKVLNRVYPGYKLSFLIPEPGQLEQLQMFSSPLEGFMFTLIDGFYEVSVISRAPEIRYAFKHGTITDSLFMAAIREDIPDLTTMEMADIFGGVIDFILDPRLGDNFSILFEEKYLDGEFVGTGDIIAAQFTNQGKQYVAVQYENADGRLGYYDPNGESMRKAFLRTPLDVFRITSNFNPARRHPILNTIRAHRGTDYAAPRGTPVRATSDGTVSWSGRNGSFGNLIVIEHDGAFETKYAHLSGYADGIRNGTRVRQGQIIGYVGATGSATGPHLHYEFLVNGVHQNPRTVLDQLPEAVSIPEEERQRSRIQVSPLLERFAALEQARVLSERQQGAE